MAESPTGTDNGTSSDSQNESLLETAIDQTADERNQGTDSGDSGASQDSGDDSSDSHDDDGSDDGLSNFARSQGFDPDNLSDTERKALKLAHDNQKAYRQESQKKADQLRKATETVHEADLSEDDDDLTRLLKAQGQQIAQLSAAQRTSDFYRENKDARDYDEDMAKILAEAAQNNGKEVARYLAQDLPTLLGMAKARRGQDSSEAAREAGRREERELLRRKQEGSTDSVSASTSQRKSQKVTQDWVDTVYDPSNAEHRKMLDEAMARGDLY